MKTFNIKIKIAEYFFQNPSARHRVRGLERTLKLPLPSIIRYCKELDKEGILKKIDIEDVTFYSANKNNEEYLFQKKLFNIKQIHNSKLIEHLKKTLNNPVIILFGSYSKGEDDETSDIDLYIETTTKKIDLKTFEKFFGKNIQIFTYKNINEIPNKHLANNILNGIVLNNYVEVLK